MNSEDFVRCFKVKKEELLSAFLDPSSGTEVATQISAITFSTDQLAALDRILDLAMTDAFYTILLALDGCASLGGVQQCYQIRDEDGDEVCNGDGTVEALAYAYFHGNL